MPAQKLNEFKAVILVEIESQLGVKLIVEPAPAAVVLMDVLRLSENRDHCLFFFSQTYLFPVQDHLFQ